jgi:hypothetical protein
MSHEWQLLAAAANGDSDKVGLMILTGTQSIDCGSREGHLHSVQWLLMSKTDVNAVNRDNVTPLHLAALGRNEAIVVLLLRERACVDAVDKNNTTSLFAYRYIVDDKEEEEYNWVTLNDIFGHPEEEHFVGCLYELLTAYIGDAVNDLKTPVMQGADLLNKRYKKQ